MKSRRLTPLLFAALGLSLVLHVLLVFGDSLYRLRQIATTTSQPDTLLSPVEHHLQRQTIDLSANEADVLPGVHPVDTLVVSMAPPHVHTVVAAKPASNHKVSTPKPIKKKAPVVQQADAPSQQPTPPEQMAENDVKPALPTETPTPAEGAAMPPPTSEGSGDSAVPNAPPAPTPAPTPTAAPVAPAAGADAIASTTPVALTPATPPPTGPTAPVDNTPAASVTSNTPPAPANTKAAGAASPTAAPIVISNTFPSSVDISYTVKSLLTAEHHWRLKGSHYQIATKTSLFGLGLEMRSEGDIGQHGLRPAHYYEYRNNQPAPHYQVDFDWDAHMAHFGDHAFEKEAKLSDSAEDIFSAAYQFALQGDQVPSFNIQVFTGRKEYLVQFAIKGETKLRLSGQVVPVLVLAGSKDTQRFEFYLAPAWHNLPVRIHFTDSEKGDDYDLIATRVSINKRTVLQPTSQEMVN